MKQLYLLVFLIGLLACQQKQADTTKTPNDSLAGQTSLTQSSSETPGPTTSQFLIIPGQQVGPINAMTTEAGLIALLGAGQVQRDTIYVAEGNYAIGTTLYKNTADQAQIFWTDTVHFARPESVLIRPARDENDNILPGAAGLVTQWLTNNGITIGTSLRDVEKLNGRAFALYGFGWDYGGLSSGWKGGALEQKDGKTYIGMGFGVPESQSAAQEKLYESLMGDQEFMSNHPAMKKLNPTVQNLTISFK